MALDGKLILQLQEILGIENVHLENEELENNSTDYTEDLKFLPECVIYPNSAQELSEVMKHLNLNKIPVYTRGAGTGLSGACLPVKGGVVISTKKMNRILEIDTQNFQATVEPGVINAVLKSELIPYGLFYPPDPASQGSSTIGGNIAHGAGGPKAVKYGTTRDYILNLEVVLPTGEIIWTGANTLKNSTGLSLTQLFIGSEGMLGIVTKAVVKLVKLPGAELLMVAAFSNAVSCAKTVNQILLNGFNPSGIELMERSAIEISMRSVQLSFPLIENCDFYLLIVLEETRGIDLMQEAERLYPFLEEQGAIEVFIPNNSDMQENWWKVRRSMGTAVKQESIYKEEDTVVPRAKLPELITGVKEIGAKYGFRSVCYGHAGDGNLHVNILKDNLTDLEWNTTVIQGIREIFSLCHTLGGTISGEHGVGLVQKDYLDIVFTNTHLSLMKGIKQVFDPNGIMNPGKWL
jgi:glycolate oxidase